MVAAFCERLGWYDLEALIVKFQVWAVLGQRSWWGRDGNHRLRSARSRGQTLSFALPHYCLSTVF